MRLIITTAVREKLKSRHQVSVAEVEQAVRNRVGALLADTREEHLTDPPTLWFLAETNKGRLLKVMVVVYNGNVHVKSAYEPSDAVRRLYGKLAGGLF